MKRIIKLSDRGSGGEEGESEGKESVCGGKHRVDDA